MKLQEKTLLVFIVLLISVLVVISIFFSTILLASYSGLEEQYIEKDLGQAVSKLDDELFTMSSIVSDWGPWDDTVDFVNGNDPEYLKSNLQPYGFDNLNLNLIVLTNTRGEVLFSGAYDLGDKVMVPVPAFFSGKLELNNPLMNMSDPHQITTGILMLPDDPMLVVSQPIVHSDFSGPPQGVVIMGRYLNKAEISRLGELTRPSLTFTRTDDPALSPELVMHIREDSGSAPGIIAQLNRDEVAGYALIKDIYGNDALVLQITEARDIYHQGLTTTMEVFMIIILSGVFLGLVVIILLDRLLLERMNSLAEQVYKIGKSGSTTEHVEIGGDDELSGLAVEINRMLDTIELTQAKVQASEARFRGLAENLPLVIFEMDTTGRLQYVNKAGVEIFGVTEDKIAQGINIRYYLSPENIGMMERGLTAVLSGTRSPGETYTLTRSDGSLMKAIVYTSLIYREEKVTGFRGIVIDISGRLELEEALKDSEEKYRTLAENSADIIFSLDITGTFTYISPQVSRYGYTPPEIVGKGIQMFIHPDDHAKVLDNYHREMKDGSSIASTFRIIDKPGALHWVEENSNIKFDDQGKPMGMVGILRDVTDRMRAEDAIDLANKKLNLMNNITRHDILNTISGLLGCVDMANATSSPEEKTRLLNDIRDLTRIIQRQIEFTREYQEVGVHLPLWQNVQKVIDKVLQNFEKTDLHFSINSEDMEIYADPLLEKVFYNLVDNAKRYGETITTIRISTQASGKGTLLIFADDGIGIPVDQKIRIFERGVGRNTGMGLFLTREILSITGITIKENGVPGKGARFEILIPWGTFRSVSDRLPHG